MASGDLPGGGSRQGHTGSAVDTGSHQKHLFKPGQIHRLAGGTKPSTKGYQPVKLPHLSWPRLPPAPRQRVTPTPPARGCPAPPPPGYWRQHAETAHCNRQDSRLREASVPPRGPWATFVSVRSPDPYLSPMPISRAFTMAGGGGGLGQGVTWSPTHGPLPSLRDLTGRSYPGVRSKGLPDC